MRKAPTARKTRASSDKKPTGTAEPFMLHDFEDEELAPAIQELRPMVEKDRNRSLQFYYMLGKKVVKHYNRVAAEREKYGWKMYGERFFERLAKAIDFSADLLHNSYKLATVYDEEAFQELCDHPQIQPSHALQLSYVPDADLRSELQAKVIDEEMTVRDIQREVRTQYGQRRKQGAGRPLKKPKDVKAAVRHASEQVKKFVKLSDQVWFGDAFSIPDEAADMPADKLSEEFKEQVSEAADLFAKLSEAATENADALRSTLKDIESRLQAQAELTAQIKAEADKEEEMAGGSLNPPWLREAYQYRRLMILAKAGTSHMVTRFKPDMTLSREGDALILRPACAEVLGRLQTIEHVMTSNPGKGCHVGVMARRLYQEMPTSHLDAHGASESMGTTMAGLEPVVRRLLRENGYRVDTPTPVDSLPEADLGAVRGHGIADQRFLDAVGNHDRLIVRHGHRVDPAWLVAQIALAYPDLSIMVAATRTKEARAIAARIRQWAPDSVSVIRSGCIPGDLRQIVVGTPQGLLGGCVDIHRRGLCIVLDAVEVLGRFGQQVLRVAESARLLGLLPDDRRLAPRDVDHIRCFFGFEEVHVPLHGHHPLPVDVVFERISGGQPLFPVLDTIELRRQATWHNAIWNRRIARLARSLRDDDRQGLQHFPRAFQAACGRDTRRVAVLVENVEHGLQLARKLPGWPLVAGAEVNVRGLSRGDRNLLGSITSTSDNHDHGIFTYGAAGQIDPHQIDVLIRADAGTGLPPLNDHKLMLPNGADNRMLLLDFDDRRHHDLGRWTRKRRRAYRERGWYQPGADPVEERVSDFLATRPTA